VLLAQPACCGVEQGSGDVAMVDELEKAEESDARLDLLLQVIPRRSDGANGLSPAVRNERLNVGDLKERIAARIQETTNFEPDRRHPGRIALVNRPPTFYESLDVARE
jgi:hypothetical protein